MTKKQFSDKCKELEEAGWTIITYEPLKKKAVYQKGKETYFVK